MLNYVKYLLYEYPNLPFRMINARQTMLINNDAPDFIVNLILDTELHSYVAELQDHKLEKVEISEPLNVLTLDSLVSGFKDIVKYKELRTIMDTHFNPIWRVAAFFCGFLLRAHEVYTSEHQ